MDFGDAQFNAPAPLAPPVLTAATSRRFCYLISVLYERCRGSASAFPEGVQARDTCDICDHWIARTMLLHFATGGRNKKTQRPQQCFEL
jgi:hypothetical protein